MILPPLVFPAQRDMATTIANIFYEIIQVRLNSDKSFGSFSCQVAAWVAIMFCNFYLVKNHKIANNSTSAVQEKN